jgi:hypothetical protein
MNRKWEIEIIHKLSKLNNDKNKTKIWQEYSERNKLSISILNFVSWERRERQVHFWENSSSQIETNFKSLCQWENVRESEWKLEMRGFVDKRVRELIAPLSDSSFQKMSLLLKLIDRKKLLLFQAFSDKIMLSFQILSN